MPFAEQALSQGCFWEGEEVCCVDGCVGRGDDCPQDRDLMVKSYTLFPKKNPSMRYALLTNI